MLRPNLYLVDETAHTVTIRASGMFGTNDMVLPMSCEEFSAAVVKWISGELVQNAFPKFSVEQREFLITGMSIKQQKELFGTDSNPEAN